MNRHPIELLEPVFRWLDWLIAEHGHHIFSTSSNGTPCPRSRESMPSRIAARNSSSYAASASVASCGNRFAMSIRTSFVVMRKLSTKCLAAASRVCYQIWTAWRNNWPSSGSDMGVCTRPEKTGPRGSNRCGVGEESNWRGASVWASASGSGTEGRSGVYSAAETGVQRGAAEPQTEARRNGRCEIPVRDERERNAANRTPPGGGWGPARGRDAEWRSVGHGGLTGSRGGTRPCFPFPLGRVGLDVFFRALRCFQ